MYIDFFGSGGAGRTVAARTRAAGRCYVSSIWCATALSERDRSPLNLRLRFEELLASLSVGLSKVSAADVDRFDQEVERSLREVADFLEVDRGGLIEFPRGSGGPARSWAIEERLDVKEFPWTTARLKGGDAVGFSPLGELPAERRWIGKTISPFA